MYNIHVAILHGSYAGMAELADALDSGSSESNFMEVQVLLPAPTKKEKLRFSFFVGASGAVRSAAPRRRCGRRQSFPICMANGGVFAAKEKLQRMRSIRVQESSCPHQKKNRALGSFPKGQFCKNTVYLERGMPYFCICQEK